MVWLMKIPGFLVGCLPVSGILSSTLECFYSQPCLNELSSYLSLTRRFSAMVLAEKSRYRSNSTVKSIVDNLMVEDWMTNISYDKYYAQCAPASCTYSKTHRHSLMFVLTQLMSVLSGLTLALGLMIPAAVRFIRQPISYLPSPQIPRK